MKPVLDLNPTHYLQGRTIRQMAILALFSAYCITLLALRFMWTGKITYSFLAWNLFLAWMPIGFSTLAEIIFEKSRNFFLAAIFLVPWLLFLPNAPYIITDLVHLKARVGVPYWYDILMLASLAFAGLLCGFFSLAQIHRIIAARIRPIYGWALMALFAIGSSYGIYLGRVQRWNSWDILRHPMRIALDVVSPLIHPYAHKEAIVMTAVLSAFLFLGYAAFQTFEGSVKRTQNLR
jgi:uncharacterized membrane protein